MLYRHRVEHCPKAAAITLPGTALPGDDRQTAALLDLAARQDDLAAIETLAREIRGEFSQLVVAGMGGSGLSARALFCLRPQEDFHCLENIDPDAIAHLMQRLNWKQAFFIFISKSGATAETLAQFSVLWREAEMKLGPETSRHFLVITGRDNNPLRRAAAQKNIRTLDHEDDIGGRFSILTNVGLLPGAIAGLDIRALRRGAQTVAMALKTAGEDFAPAVGASLQHALLLQGRNISVMMPYAERLSGFADWYRQCWAESLGKNGKGSTPVRALGAADQHSQLQLYLDGPKDKFFTLVTLARGGQGQRIESADPELAYLNGRTIGDLMQAEQNATIATLANHGCPVRVIELAQPGEEEFGALIMHFMIEVIFMARLMGVNPFDQPAVEESKRLARQYLAGEA